MNNSFNTCPRCGSTNSLSARYCSRCGVQLQIPEEATVCYKCHTHNSPMANFCRNCGSPLNVVSQPRICPRCGAEVSHEKTTCNCGFQFDTVRQSQPVVQSNIVDVETSDNTEEKVKRKYKPYDKASGVLFALLALLLLAAFVYFAFVANQSVTLESLNDKLRLYDLCRIDNGVTNSTDADGNVTYHYGYNYVERVFCRLCDSFDGEIRGEQGQLEYFLGEFSENGQLALGEIVLAGCCILFAISALIHLFVCFARLSSGRRSKHSNVLYLILALLTGTATALIVLTGNGTLSLLPLCSGVAVGWCIYAIPGYYFVFYLYSLLAKARRAKADK